MACRAVLFIFIGGIEFLRESAGPEAAEAALTKAIEVLKSETDLADIVGYLDGGNFVVALALVADTDAQAHGQRLADRLSHMSFLWNGVRPVFTIEWSAAPFVSGEEAGFRFCARPTRPAAAKRSERLLPPTELRVPSRSGDDVGQ